MAIIPTVRRRRMATSLAFYTNVLDFDCVEYGGEGDPSFSTLMRCLRSSAHTKRTVDAGVAE